MQTFWDQGLKNDDSDKAKNLNSVIFTKEISAFEHKI